MLTHFAQYDSDLGYERASQRSTFSGDRAPVGVHRSYSVSQEEPQGRKRRGCRKVLHWLSSRDDFHADWSCSRYAATILLRSQCAGIYCACFRGVKDWKEGGCRDVE